jgi:serum/glucocorticoid-regulated kinase 2
MRGSALTELRNGSQVLGKGSFGKVMLVKKKDSGQLYAMKTLRKSALVKRNQVTNNDSSREMALITLTHSLRTLPRSASSSRA